MKRVVDSERDPDMLDEYDFSPGVRGKYADRYAAGSNVVIIAPDVASACWKSSLRSLPSRQIKKATDLSSLGMAIP